MKRSNSEQASLALRFQELHAGPEPLILPNAWDAGSAVIFEQAGFEAIGTTSAGIAFSLGRGDGQHISLEELVAVQTQIINRISVPLSVDIEMGYGSTGTEVLATVERVVTSGAVGVNLEDASVAGDELVDLKSQCEVLSAMRRYKGEVGIPFVINARTDHLWLRLGTESEGLEASIRRGNEYLEAGADCVFVPGDLSREVVEVLVREINGPLNLIVSPNGPSLRELEELGVARLSTGSGPIRASLELTRQIARDVNAGSLESLTNVSLGYHEANSMFE